MADVSMADQLGTFPSDGGVQPFPAGRIDFDFVNNVVRGPNGTISLGFPNDLLGNVNACAIFVDTQAQVQLPDYSNVNFLVTGDRVDIPIHLDHLTIVAALPCNIAIIATNRGTPPALTEKTTPQIRQSNQIITKVNAAGVADPWTDVLFVPVYDTPNGLKSIPQSPFGMAPVSCMAYPLKTFLIRNSILGDPAVTAIETQVVGAMASGPALQSGYVIDQDAGGVLKTGTSASNVVKTSTRWDLIKLQVRVPAGVAAGQATPITVEYRGSPESIVEATALIPPSPASIASVTATGTGAMSLGLSPNAATRFVRVEVTFTVAPITVTDLIALTVKPIEGVAYNTVWWSDIPANPARTSLVWPGGQGYDMKPGDQLSLAFPNNDGRTWTARILYESPNG